MSCVYRETPINYLRELSHRIFDQLGFGFSEKVYQKALVRELQYRYPNIESEYSIPQYYITSTGERIQLTVLKVDIWIAGQGILIELKTVQRGLNKGSKEWLQLERYSKILGAEVKHKYLINFGLLDVEIIDESEDIELKSNNNNNNNGD